MDVHSLEEYPYRRTGKWPTMKLGKCCLKCINIYYKEILSEYVPFSLFYEYNDLCDKITNKGMYRFSRALFIQDQNDMCQRSFRAQPNKPTIFLVSCHLPRDVIVLDWALSLTDIKIPKLYEPCDRSILPLIPTLQRDTNISIPVRINDCCVEDVEEQICWQLNDITELLKELTDHMTVDQNMDVRIVPVVISKDHDQRRLVGSGSICLHILQPYYAKSFTQRCIRTHSSEPLHVSIAKHFGYDTAANAPILASSLVAFIIVYHGRTRPVKLDDLEALFNWFLHYNRTYSLKIAFRLDPKSVIRESLSFLNDLISFDEERKIVTPTQIDKLKCQADLVVTRIVRFGIIARSILMEHIPDVPNRTARIIRANMTADIFRVRETAKKLVILLDNRLPFRRPCDSVDKFLDTIFGYMSRKLYFSTQLKISEGIYGDYTTTELPLSYSANNGHRVRVTEEQLLVDLLNLSSNAIEDYLNQL